MGTKATAVTVVISFKEPPVWFDTKFSFACFRKAFSVMLMVGEVSDIAHVIVSED